VSRLLRTIRSRHAGWLGLALAGLCALAAFAVSGVRHSPAESLAAGPPGLGHVSDRATNPPVPLTPTAELVTRRPDTPDRIRSVVSGSRLVNYYPARDGWSTMWTNWQPQTIRHDMDVAHQLGANSIRLIVFPYVMGWPTVTAPMEARLESALVMAQNAGLSVQLTLFDHWQDYEDLTGSATWTRGLLAPVADYAALSNVEVQNEVEPTGAGVIRWVRAELADVRAVAPGVPVTVSAAHQLSGLLELKGALAPSAPDFWDLHYYGTAQSAYPTFVAARRAAAPRPLLVGEAGLSTYPAAVGARTSAEAKDLQHSWYEVVGAAAVAAHLPPVAPWTLFDFTRSGIPSSHAAPVQFKYGLLTTEGTRKPAAAVVAAAFAGRLRPHVINPGLEPVGDGSSDPRGWVAYYPSGTMADVRAPGRATGWSMMLSGTKQLAGGWSSFYAVPMQPVKPGQVWRLSVRARGQHATGTSEALLAWFAANGRWLGNSGSRALPTGTTSWRTLRLRATVPAGAASVRVYVASSANRGTAWFTHPTWSVDAPGGASR
jgi:hypothetical protein